MTFESSGWRNDSWGFHAVYGTSQSGTVAVSASGSRMNGIEASSYKYLILPSGSGIVERWLVPSENAVYSRFNRGEVRRETCTCTFGKTRREFGADCQGAVEFKTGGAGVRTGEGQIAGHRVVRWRVPDRDDEFAFAPALGCELMERVRTEHGFLGIPSSRTRFIVTSYKVGEPDPRLLQPPSR